MQEEPKKSAITDVEELRQHLINNATYIEHGTMHTSQRRMFDRHKNAGRIYEGMALIEEYRVFVVEPSE